MLAAKVIKFTILQSDGNLGKLAKLGSDKTKSPRKVELCEEIAREATLPADFAGDAAADDQEFDPLRLESLAQDLDGFSHLHGAAAIEQVNGGITMLGPGVNRVVRLLNDHRSAYAPRLELMERIGNYGGFASVSRFLHRGRDGNFFFQGPVFAAVKLDQQMRTQRRLLFGAKGKSFFVVVQPRLKLLDIVAVNERPTGFLLDDRRRNGVFNRIAREKSSQETSQARALRDNEGGKSHTATYKKQIC